MLNGASVRPVVDCQMSAKKIIRIKKTVKLTRKEAIQLHQDPKIDIVTLGGRAVRALHVVAVKINT